MIVVFSYFVLQLLAPVAQTGDRTPDLKCPAGTILIVDGAEFNSSAVLGKDQSPVERIQEVVFEAGYRSSIYGPYNLRHLDGFTTGRDVARLAPKLIIVHYSAFYRERPKGNPNLRNFLTEVGRSLQTKPYFLIYSYAFKNAVPSQKALASELGTPALANAEGAEAMAVEDRGDRITTPAVKGDLAARIKRLMRKFPNC